MTDIKVDEDFKAEAAKSKEEMSKKESNYVNCAEVTEYLSDLSMVMMNIANGIQESIQNMNNKMEQQKGDANEHKE